MKIKRKEKGRMLIPLQESASKPGLGSLISHLCYPLELDVSRVDSLEKTDAGRDWGQEEKGTTKDEMAGWHHRLDGCEFE